MIVYEKHEVGYAICSECDLILRSTGASGTSTLNKHCQMKHNASQKIEMFSTHKRVFGQSVKDEFKEAQTDFCMNTLSSFSINDSSGFHEFCDFLIKFGAQHGAAEAQDVLFTRRAIKHNVIAEVEKVDIILKKRISGKPVCFTSDLWSTKYTNDSFLDIHIVWVENCEIHYCQIGMINVEERHTADVIKNKLIDVITKYTDIEKKVFITTDSGANMLKAVKDFDSLRCLCHRLNSSINDGWKNALANNSDLNNLNESVSNLPNSLSHATDIQTKLPVKVKSGPHTREWRGLITKFTSVQKSFDSLKEVLDDKKTAHLQY